MKNKKNLVAIISVILLLAVFLLGANTVFSVTHVEIAYALFSPQAYEDSLTLQGKLEKKYVGDNILFIQDEAVISHFDAYPYLSVIGFEKVYPNKLRLSVEEKLEKYAFAIVENEAMVYYMTDANGEILDKREENKNNVDGGGNFLIEGLLYSAEKGFYCNSNDNIFSVVLQICNKMEALTGGVRTCLSSMNFSSNAVGTELKIYTAEGVTIRIDLPETQTEAKIEKAVNFYLLLNTEDKLYGEIYAFDKAEQSGEVGISYTPRI